MKSIDLIIFDCDGVLVDTETVAAQVLSSYFADHGVSLSAGECHARFTGMALSAVQEQFEAMGGIAPDDFIVRIRATTLEALSHGVEPIPGIHELLTQISQPFCVASGGMPEKIRQSLSLANLLDQFEPHIFSAFDIGSHKPEPHLFLYAAETMGIAPANTLVIEDSRVGVQAGVAAGMTVVGYAAVGQAADLRTLGAHHVVEDIRMVAEIL